MGWLARLSASPDRAWLAPLLVFVGAFIVALPVAWHLGRNLPDRAVRLETGGGPAILWPFGVDLYPRWVGGRALLRGENPYGPGTEAETHLAVYGRPRRPEEPRFGFYYPAYVVALVGPLLPLPLEAAARVWGAVNLAVLLTLGLVIAWRVSPRPPPVTFGLGLLSLSLFWPGVLNATVGQYGLVTVGLGALGWGLLRSNRDIPAGAVLALATIKPSVSFLPIGLVLGWAAARRRFGVLAGFGVCLAGLVVATSIPAGWWVADFILGLPGYQVDVGSAFVTWKPADGLTLPAALGLLGSGWLLVRSVREVLRTDDIPGVGLSGALVLNLLLTPHVGIFDLVGLLIPLGWLLGRWAGSALAFTLWLGLVWFPLLLGIGFRADGRWVWATWPVLVIGAVLAEIYLDSRRPVAKAC